MNEAVNDANKAQYPGLVLDNVLTSYREDRIRGFWDLHIAMTSSWRSCGREGIGVCTRIAAKHVC